MSELHQIPWDADGKPKADVVFVHGLSGHPFETWQHDRRTPQDSWPFWLAEAAPEIAVWTLGYDAAWHQWFGRDAMPLPYRALDVLGELVSHDIGGKSIGFVCHSLGGLLVKKVLESAATLNNPDWRPIAQQTRAIAFVGTPHAGADLASLLFRLGQALGKSPAIADLRAHNPNLIQLNIWYRQNVDQLHIHTLSYFETRKTKMKLFGFLPWGVQVVASGDADPGVAGVIPSPLDGNHFAICRPLRRDSRLCREVEKLVRELVARPPVESGGEIDDDLKPIIVDPLPLPADLGDFQDRGEKQAALLAALTTQGQAAAIIALGGMGGIGKTALAIHAARQLGHRFPEGVRYLDLKGIPDELESVASKPLTPIEAMGRVIQSFDEKAKIPEDLDQAGALYRYTLNGKRILLLLDNARDSEQVRPLLDPKNRGAATIIVTSRRTITADGLTPIQLDQMSPEEGRGFLVQMLGHRGASNEELDRLIERCGHLPLALRVAGRFLQDHPDWSVTEYVDAVNNGEVELDIEGEKNKDVLAVLGLSTKQLAKEDPSLAARWRTLVVFPDSFGKPAAATLWAMEERKARADLSALVGRSMLLFDAAAGRYRLHDLMRGVARLPLEDEDEATVEARLGEAAGRHAQHYCTVLAEANNLYLKGGENVLAGLRRYDIEQRNIAAGQEWAVKQIEISDDAARLAAEYAQSGVDVLRLRLDLSSQVAWFQAQLRASQRLGDRRGEAVARGALGDAYRDLGDAQTAIRHQEERLKIAREVGDRENESYALGGLGDAYRDLGQTKTAIKHQEERLKIASEVGDRQNESYALGALGDTYRKLGETRRAIEYQEMRLEVARKSGDQKNEWYALGALGDAHRALGEPQRAIKYHEARLKIAREDQDRQNAGYALGALGETYREMGEAKRAIEHHEQRLKIAREVGNRREESYALGALGDTYRELGEKGKAIEHHGERLRLAREIGDRREESYALGALGDTYRELGEPGRSLQYQEKRLELTRALGELQNESYALGALGDAYRELGQPRRAIEYYGKRLELARRIQDRRGESYAFGGLGDAYRDLHETQQAIEHYKEHLAIAQQTSDRLGEGNALFNSALAFDQLKDRGVAIARMQKALAIFEQIENSNAARARAQLAEWRGEDGG